jgi:hypothetical protein
MVVAGALGAVVGFFGGAMIGYSLERHYWPCDCDDPGLGGFIYGSAIGSAIAVPVAVHLANQRRGSFGRTLGVSSLVAAVGLLGLFATSDSEAGLFFLLGAPVAEVGISVAVEKSTTR